MCMEIHLKNGTLKLIQGDITEQNVDAIVNAANSHLKGGGGVDGAIHRAAGPELYEECRRIIARIGMLEPGNAVYTGSGRLKERGIRWVIHTVGPIWRGGSRGEAEVLERCYRNSMELARKIGAKSVAFPSISTGAYGYPVEEAARVVLPALMDELETRGGIQEVRMVLYLKEDFITYSDVLGALMGR